MEVALRLRLAFCLAVPQMLVPAIGTARNFDAGLAAAQVGDFAIALREWKPLAMQGRARATPHCMTKLSSISEQEIAIECRGDGKLVQA